MITSFMPKSQKEIKALQKKLDKISMQLMKRYEEARSTHGKLLRSAISKKKSRDWNKTFKPSTVAQHKMEKAQRLLQAQLRISGNNRRRLN